MSFLGNLPRILSVFVFCVVALFATGPEPSPSNPEAITRALGFGFTGYVGGLDAPLSALASILPFGTRAARATLVSIALAAWAVDSCFLTLRDVLNAWGKVPRMSDAIAGVATLMLAVSGPFLREATSIGGAVPGTLLGILVVRQALAPQANPVIIAVCTGLCTVVEPALTLVLLAPLLLNLRHLSAPRGTRRIAALGVVLALPILVLGATRLRQHGSQWLSLGEPIKLDAMASRPLLSLLVEEWGWIAATLAIVGAIIGLMHPPARRPTSTLLALAGAAMVSVWQGAHAGPTRFSAAALLLGFALVGLGTLALGSLLAVVEASKLPLSKTSAWLVLALETTLPLAAGEAGFARTRAATTGKALVMTEILQGELPSGAILVIESTDLLLPLLAERAAGTLRPDIGIFPARALNSPMAAAELSLEPKLSPLWQELALRGAASERALAGLSSDRPTVVEYVPTLSRTAARYLAPVGLLQAFYPEPRGASDRKKALELFEAPRQRLVDGLVGPSTRRSAGLGGTPHQHPEAIALATRLLRARAIAVARAGDRDVVPLAMADLRALRPKDPLLAILERRLVETKGVLPTDDLIP